jgi:hypothetical protein
MAIGGLFAFAQVKRAEGVGFEPTMSFPIPVFKSESTRLNGVGVG